MVNVQYRKAVRIYLCNGAIQTAKLLLLCNGGRAELGRGGLKTSRCPNAVERPDGVAGRGAWGETLQEDQPWRTLHRGRGVAVKRSAADIQARRYRFLPLGASRVFRQPRVTSSPRYPCGSVPLGSESRKRLGTSCKGYDSDSSASWLSSAESKSVTRMRARSDLPAGSGDAAFR